MEFSQKTTQGNASVDLATFLDHHECTLPKTVKLFCGFRGTNADDTLEADQIFVFFKVERHKAIMAINQNGQEVCVQQNSNTKVHLLPLECRTYSTVQELLTAKSPFILILEDILSAGIVSGSKLRLSSDQKTVSNYLKCQVGDQGDFKDVLLPLHLAGKFLPLLDVSDYYLNEVLAQNQLPVNVRFVSQSPRINDRFIAHSLTSLGNIRLTRKTEVEMVFAASIDNKLSLYLFPKTLDINVGCEFRVSAETRKKIKECTTTLESSETAIKRLDNIVKSSFHFTACPVRRFNLQSLQKTPPMPPPRTLGAKHGQLPEENFYVNEEESTKYDLVKFAYNERRSSRKPISGECEDGDYENCKMGKKSEIFTDGRRLEEDNAPSSISAETIDPNSEIPALPSKRRSASTVENASKDAKPQSPSRPVPMPRRRLVKKEALQEKMSKDFRTHWKGGNVVENTELTYKPRTLSEDHVDEVCPELPPKPIFLQQLDIDEEEPSIISQEDCPPPLPPKQGEETCPEERSQCAQIDTSPPPELPPRDKSPGESHLGLAYSAVDVTDWKRYEDPYGPYAEVKDDGRVFKQNETRNFVTENSLAMKDQKPGGETPYEEMERLPSREAGMQVEEQSSEDEMVYEEVIVSHKPLQNEFPWETNTGQQMKAGVKKPSKNSSSNNSSNHNACPTQTSRERAVKASHPVNNNKTWISSRSEEDWMDFKDIEQFLKLREQLNNARAQVQHLKQQVAVKEQDPADGTRMQLPDTSDGITYSCGPGNIEDSQHLENDSKNENRKNGKSNSKNEGDGFGKSMEKEKPNQSSLVVNNNIPKKAESIVKERKMSTPSDSESDDDDDYEQCYDRKYVNQDITAENNLACRVSISKEDQCSSDSTDDEINPTYYNTVEIEAMTDGTSRYLQLGNSSDEDENDYVNVAAQIENIDHDDVKAKPFGTTEEDCDTIELPPLPPKQMARCS